MKKNIKEVPFDAEKLLRRVTDYAQGKALGGNGYSFA
jgi:hypothetical protein